MISSLICGDSHPLLLSLVPVPLVHLALAETELPRYVPDVLARPVRVLQELVLEDLQLFLVLSLATLNVPNGALIVFRFFKQSLDTIIQVLVLKLERFNVEKFSKKLVVFCRVLKFNFFCIQRQGLVRVHWACCLGALLLIH